MKISPSLLHAFAIIGFIGLFLLLMLWNTVLTPPSKTPIALLLIVSVTPLLLPMRGFLQGKPKSCAWMSYISLIYLIHGTAEAYSSETARLLAWLEIAMSLLLFFGSTLYIRLSKSIDARTNTNQV